MSSMRSLHVVVNDRNPVSLDSAVWSWHLPLSGVDDGAWRSREQRPWCRYEGCVCTTHSSCIGRNTGTQPAAKHVLVRAMRARTSQHVSTRTNPARITTDGTLWNQYCTYVQWRLWALMRPTLEQLSHHHPHRCSTGIPQDTHHCQDLQYIHTPSTPTCEVAQLNGWRQHNRM